MGLHLLSLRTSLAQLLTYLGVQGRLLMGLLAPVPSYLKWGWYYLLPNIKDRGKIIERRGDPPSCSVDNGQVLVVGCDA